MRLPVEIVAILAAAVAIFFAVPQAVHRKRQRRRPARPQRPADLERLERLVVTARATAADVHLRLRPVLQEMAAARLRRRGVWLDRSPEEARRLLGEELWELVRTDRPRPADPRAPGLSIEQLTSVIMRLERL